MPREALAELLREERAQGTHEGATEALRHARREPVRATTLPVVPLLTEAQRARMRAIAEDEMFDERWGR
jgi:hypothetical protein